MSLPNMQELMEKAKEMQEQMQKAQQEITAIEVEGSAGGGVVKIKMNGAHQALKTTISPAMMGEDADILEDLVTAAINDASSKIEGVTKERMMSMAKDFQLPEDFGSN